MYNHLHNARQYRLRPDLLGAHHQRSVGVKRRADQLVARALGYRDRLAGEHRFVHRAAAFDDDTVDGHFLPRAHTQRVTHMDVSEGNVLLGAVGVDSACCLGRQAQQRFDRRRRLRARFEFENLAKQSQRNDHGRRFKVDRHAAHAYERCGEHAWRHRCDYAVDKSRGGAQADQRPHVRAAMEHRPHRTFKEGPARPEDDG